MPQEADQTSSFYHAELALVLLGGYTSSGAKLTCHERVAPASRLADNTQAAACLEHAYAIAGRRVDAQRVIADLVENSTRRYVSPYDIATVWAGLGDEAQTLRWLEKAHDDRSGWLALWSKVDPKFDAIRSGSQFQSLLRRTGLIPQTHQAR